MGHRLLLLLIFAVFSSPFMAFGSEGPYMNIQGGSVILDRLTYKIGPINVPPLGWPFSQPGFTIPEFKEEYEYKDGFGVSTSFGYDFGSFRLEAELGYAENKVAYYMAPVFTAELSGDGSEILMVQSDSVREEASGDISAMSFMLNGYYDIENRTIFTPYLMGGLGAIKVSVDHRLDFDDGRVISKLKDDDTALTYMLGAGISTALSDRIQLDLEYQFLGSRNLRFRGNSYYAEEIMSEYKAQNISLGLRWYF